MTSNLKMKWDTPVDSPTVASDVSVTGTDPFWGHDFLPILVIIIILFFFCEKVSSGIWETCPKIIGGLRGQPRFNSVAKFSPTKLNQTEFLTN